MNLNYLLGVLGFTIIAKSSALPVWTLIHDIVQNNIAGLPVIHEYTEWDFDPKQGKARQVQYENLNGEHGEDLIERLGKGKGYNKSWGVKVSKAKADLRYNA